MLSLVTAACLWAVPAVTSAQQAPAVLSVDEIRSRFARSGYQVGDAHSWDWTVPPFTSFRVSDGPSGRVLAVVVYPSTDAADTARALAARDQAQNTRKVNGPYLVTGFGPTLWNGNVAMAESTDVLLMRMSQIQVGRNDAMFDAPSLAASEPPPSVAVDLDFQQALVGSAANL